MKSKIQSSKSKIIFKSKASNFWIWKLLVGVYFGFLILCFGFPAEGWRITPDLQKEVNQKQAAVKQKPNDPEAHFELAMTYAYTNNIIDGMSELRKTNDLDPGYRLRALPVYIARATEKPNDWKLRFRLAFVYFANGKKQDAIREFENVLVIDPYNVWAYGYLALIYGEMGDIDKGIELTKKGLSIDKNVAALHLLLSEGYYKKGDNWGGWAERFEALRLKAIGY